MPRYVSSKWVKTAALLRNKWLRSLIPATVRFNRIQLYKMLQRYRMVYVKPEKGTYGKGVMRVEIINGRYRFQAGENTKFFSAFGPMFAAVHRATNGRRYLIQRGVHLLTHRGRRFDLRVMVQVSPRKTWETTGIIGRLAAPRKIVTNYHNGGTPLPLRTLLSSHLDPPAIALKARQLAAIGVVTGRAMSRQFPGVCEVGVDVGMDRTFTPWILEVNTSPDPYIFRRLPDPSVFSKIRRYAIAYGRIKPIRQK